MKGLSSTLITRKYSPHHRNTQTSSSCVVFEWTVFASDWPAQ